MMEADGEDLGEVIEVLVNREDTHTQAAAHRTDEEICS